jgi:hypothetical protein
LPTFLDVMKNSVIAAGLPHSFRLYVARALGVDPEAIVSLQSMPSVEEYLMRAGPPVDVVVVSPEVREADALGMIEFVGREYPGTAIVLVRDQTWNGRMPATMLAGIRDVVDMTRGPD